MKINCGFNRKIKGTKTIQHKNLQNIEVGSLDFENDGEEIRKELMKNRPDGDGWRITGYCKVELKP